MSTAREQKRTQCVETLRNSRLWGVIIEAANLRDCGLTPEMVCEQLSLDELQGLSQDFAEVIFKTDVAGQLSRAIEKAKVHKLGLTS